MELDSPKVNVFFAIFRRCVFGPLFSAEDNDSGKVYLHISGFSDRPVHVRFQVDKVALGQVSAST